MVLLFQIRAADTANQSKYRLRAGIYFGTPGRSRTCNLILRTDLLYPVELPRRSWKATLYSTTGNTGTYRALACILFVWHLIRIELIVAKPVPDFLLCLFRVT